VISTNSGENLALSCHRWKMPMWTRLLCCENSVISLYVLSQQNEPHEQINLTHPTNVPCSISHLHTLRLVEKSQGNEPLDNIM